MGIAILTFAISLIFYHFMCSKGEDAAFLQRSALLTSERNKLLYPRMYGIYSPTFNYGVRFIYLVYYGG